MNLGYIIIFLLLSCTPLLLDERIPLLMSRFYNTYHKKNTSTQAEVVSPRNYTYQYLIQLIQKYFKSSDARVVDIGCGVGTIDFYLANKRFQVLGIDISQRAIDLARESKERLGFKNVVFKVADIAELKIDSKFDYVVCSEVIEHVQDDGKLVADLYELLEQNGALILSTPSKNAPLYRWGKLNDFDERVGHLRRYTIERLTSLLEGVGFEVVEVRRTEGLLRNFLFTHDQFGFLLRFFKWPLTIPINLIDALLLKIFGESNIYVVAKK